MKTKHFINLTNGIEAIKDYSLEEYSFIRIQSSKCESKKWDDIIQELDSNFLLNLALGNKCIVYDFSAKRTISRAIFQGIEFIKYVLYKNWFNEKIVVFVRGNNCSEYFDKAYKNLSKNSKNKLKYYKKFLNCNKLNLETISNNTYMDGKYEYYFSILKEINNEYL